MREYISWTDYYFSHENIQYRKLLETVASPNKRTLLFPWEKINFRFVEEPVVKILSESNKRWNWILRNPACLRGELTIMIINQLYLPGTVPNPLPLERSGRTSRVPAQRRDSPLRRLTSADVTTCDEWTHSAEYCDAVKPRSPLPLVRCSIIRLNHLTYNDLSFFFPPPIKSARILLFHILFLLLFLSSLSLLPFAIRSFTGHLTCLLPNVRYISHVNTNSAAVSLTIQGAGFHRNGVSSPLSIYMFRWNIEIEEQSIRYHRRLFRLFNKKRRTSRIYWFFTIADWIIYNRIFIINYYHTSDSSVMRVT